MPAGSISKPASSSWKKVPINSGPVKFVFLTTSYPQSMEVFLYLPVSLRYRRPQGGYPFRIHRRIHRRHQPDCSLPMPPGTGPSCTGDLLLFDGHLQERDRTLVTESWRQAWEGLEYWPLVDCGQGSSSGDHRLYSPESDRCRNGCFTSGLSVELSVSSVFRNNLD